jgi:hypothetical protein
LTSLVKKIDRRVGEVAGRYAAGRALGAYLVVNDAPGLAEQLRGLEKKEGLRYVSLCIGAAPPRYEVNPEAEVTVLIYNPERRGRQKVTANFALRKGELNDAKIDDIVKALAAVLPPQAHTLVADSREKGQPWRYTFAKPAEAWFKPDFDDSSWQSGPGGFGTAGTPGAVVRTTWNTGAIWLRREVRLPEGPFGELRLQLHHDEDVEVYLNGVLAARLAGYTTGYQEVPISEEARKALRPGANVLAVSCKQTGGGQYIDVGLVELKR